MKYYKALFFGSIGSIVETSDLQRKSFNQAFKQYGLNWYWAKKKYKKLLNKSGGEDRISRYAKQKKIVVDAKKLRSLKTRIFNNFSYFFFDQYQFKWDCLNAWLNDFLCKSEVSTIDPIEPKKSAL